MAYGENVVYRGMDFEAAYETGLGSGSLTLRLLASWLYDQLFETGLTNPATGKLRPPTNYPTSWARPPRSAASTPRRNGRATPS